MQECHTSIKKTDVDLIPVGNIGTVKLDSGGTTVGFMVSYHWYKPENP